MLIRAEYFAAVCKWATFVLSKGNSQEMHALRLSKVQQKRGQNMAKCFIVMRAYSVMYMLHTRL